MLRGQRSFHTERVWNRSRTDILEVAQQAGHVSAQAARPGPRRPRLPHEIALLGVQVARRLPPGSPALPHRCAPVQPRQAYHAGPARARREADGAQPCARAARCRSVQLELCSSTRVCVMLARRGEGREARGGERAAAGQGVGAQRHGRSSSGPARATKPPTETTPETTAAGPLHRGPSPVADADALVWGRRPLAAGPAASAAFLGGA